MVSCLPASREVAGEISDLALREASLCNDMLARCDCLCQLLGGGLGREVAGETLDFALREASLCYARLLACEQRGRFPARVVAAQSCVHQRLRLCTLLVC